MLLNSPTPSIARRRTLLASAVACLLIAGTACRPATKTPRQTSPIRVPRLSRTVAASQFGSVKRTDAGWTVASGKQWAYAGGVPMLTLKDREWKGTVEVRCVVRKGRMGLGLVNQATNEFIVERVLDSRPEAYEFSIPLSSAQRVEYLIVRSAAPDGVESEVELQRADMVLNAVQVPGAADIGKIAPAFPSATVTRSRPAKVITVPQQYSYAASVPIQWNNVEGDVALVEVRVQVKSGEIGFGILNRKRGAFEAVEQAAPGDGIQSVFVPVANPGEAGDLIVRNEAKSMPSEALIEDVTVWFLP